MNGMDLFAGSGIGSLALKNIIPDYKTVCYVEWEAYCQAILISRIKDGLLDDAPIWDDVRTFDGKQWRGKVDIVYGGFPCQPFSVAGKNKGAEDERNMWPDTLRIISEVRPRFALLENVPNLLIHEYIRQIFGDLAKIGYDCEWDIISAASVGAPHKRNRIWCLAWDSSIRKWDKGQVGKISKGQEANSARGGHLLANSVSSRESQSQGIEPDKRRRVSNSRETMADTSSKGLSGPTQPGLQSIQEQKSSFSWSESRRGNSTKGGHWQVEPDVGRVADGVANRVDRLKMLGNGWVPQVVARILQIDSEKQ